MSRRSRRAFTMLEIITVMVLLVILGGLATMGVRSFLSGASEATAQTTTERFLVAERAFANSFGSYTNHPDDLLDLGRDIDVVTSPAQSSGDTSVSVAMSESGILGVAVATDAGKCLLTTVAPLSAGFAPAGSGGLDAAGSRSEAPAGAPCNGAEAIPGGEQLAADTSRR